MRISDWSSDVCSSDLLDVAVADDPERAVADKLIVGENLLGEATHHRFEGDEPDFVAGKLDEARQRGRQHQKLADQFAAPLRLQVETKERTSVAKGKRVSERVCTGGGRHIKKKKTQQKTR